MQGAAMLLKINLGGIPSVGKTSFITREIDDKFALNSYSTIGLDFFTKKFDVGRQKVKMQIWDMSGADRQMKFRKPYFRSANRHYTDSQAVLLGFALNEPYTFQAIPEWLKGVKQFELTCPIYLVGCKCDLQQTVSKEQIANLVEKEGQEYFKCSAKEDIGIKDNMRQIIEKLVAQIIKNPEKIGKAKLSPATRPASSSYCQL